MRTCAVLAALLAIGGCSAGTAKASWKTPASAGAGHGVAASPSPSPSLSPSPSRSGDITLEFAGDVHFADRTAKLLADPATAFGPIASVFKDADVAMVNLETSVTDRGTPEPKEFHFRAPATAFDAVRAAGVDVVTVANNHALDYGRTGLADTLDDAHKAGVPAIGAGQNATEAYAPWVTTVRGTRIAFVAVSQIHELESSWAATDNRSGIAMASDVARSIAAVRAARAQADVVIVYVHWGQEGNDCPTGEQKTFAARMAEAGATAVVGTHAHLLLGDGMIGKTYVAYGLGNFLWWRDDAFSNDTGVLRLTLHGGAVSRSELVPASISRDTGQPLPVSGGEADRIVKKYADLHSCTGLAPAPRG
ncbi:CapA family protein [Planosporangium thailandense]|uniref:CapA family protein n=1 Tax=Planosporangium thailandense TaxID=765197 RepID=A0ABX0XV10_9ACTN|nr:CapA family protein [Planosporangium thailandense]NJC69855.1 CapA family protein [Planosporangium thailandense]